MLTEPVTTTSEMTVSLLPKWRMPEKVVVVTDPEGRDLAENQENITTVVFNVNTADKVAEYIANSNYLKEIWLSTEINPYDFMYNMSKKGQRSVVGGYNYWEVSAAIPLYLTEGTAFIPESRVNRKATGTQMSFKEYKTSIVDDGNKKLAEQALNSTDRYYPGIFSLPLKSDAYISEWVQSDVNLALNDNILDTAMPGSDYTQNISRLQFCSVAVKLAEELTGKSITPAGPLSGCKHSHDGAHPAYGHFHNKRGMGRYLLHQQRAHQAWQISGVCRGFCAEYGRSLYRRPDTFLFPHPSRWADLLHRVR